FPNGTFVYLLLYVDDTLIASHDNHEFDMKDLGPVKKILFWNTTDLKYQNIPIYRDKVFEENIFFTLFLWVVLHFLPGVDLAKVENLALDDSIWKKLSGRALFLSNINYHQLTHYSDRQGR
ncbi:hypothetical protein ACJX0J_021848, partial [Zea mays]